MSSKLRYLLTGAVAALAVVVLGASAPVQNTILNLCPGANLCIGPSNGVLELWTDGSKRARMDSSGNVVFDDNVTITGTATLTGDVTGAGDVAGVTGTFSGALSGLTVSSTGDVSGTTGTFTGAILGLRSVEANAATKAPTAAESGEVYTNTGDADGSAVTLTDDPTIGLEFILVATAAQTITITAASGETIEANGATCGTSVTLADGDSVWIIAATGGSGAQWHVVGGQGFTCNA